MTAEFVGAIQRKEPIIGWTWEPFWLPAQYEGEFVEWAGYEDACYDDPAWGENPDVAFDCGRPTGFMWKTAWAGGEAIWPKAYVVLRKYQLDHPDNGRARLQERRRWRADRAGCRRMDCRQLGDLEALARIAGTLTVGCGGGR